VSDPAGKIAVEKAVDKCQQKRAQQLLDELYPPLAPDAPELINGIDEADDLVDWEPEDGKE